MGKRTRMPGRAAIKSGIVRVAVYLRVSTAKQVKAYGLRVQREQCSAWLDYRIGKGKYVIVEYFEDGGVSGKLASRPRLDDMNAAIQAGKIDLVVFGKLDRIGRTMAEIHIWVHSTTKNVRVATADGRIDSDDEMFGLQLSLLAYMAEMEHTLILERTMAGREQKLLDGGWPLGQPPMGLELEGHGENAVPVLSKREVKMLEAVADVMIDDGYNREEAAAHLNTLKLFTRTGKPWTGDNLGQRLMSTALDGYVEFSMANRDDPDEVVVTRISVPRPLPEDRVAELRKAMARTSYTRSTNRAYMLSKRIFGTCGAHYTGASENDDRLRYKCTGARQGLKCTDHEISATDVEQAVWGEVVKLLNNREGFHALVEEWLGRIPTRVVQFQERIAAIDAELERRTKGKKARLLALLEAAMEDDDEGEDTEETDRQAIAELKAELKNREQALRDEQATVQRWLDEAQRQDDRARELIRRVDALGPQLEAFDLSQRLDILDLLDIRVQVTGKGRTQRKGVVDPLAKWHHDNGVLVPTEVTDERWYQIESLMPASRQSAKSGPSLKELGEAANAGRTAVVHALQNTGRLSPATRKHILTVAAEMGYSPRAEVNRIVFEAIMFKLRTGARWSDLATVFPEVGWNSVYRRATAWFTSGAWEQAMRALADIPGVPVPDFWPGLPPLEVTGAVDPEFTTAQLCDETETSEQSSRILFARTA